MIRTKIDTIKAIGNTLDAIDDLQLRLEDSKFNISYVEKFGVKFMVDNIISEEDLKNFINEKLIQRKEELLEESKKLLQ